jgi:hypothetical protein
MLTTPHRALLMSGIKNAPFGRLKRAPGSRAERPNAVATKNTEANAQTEPPRDDGAHPTLSMTGRRLKDTAVRSSDTSDPLGRGLRTSHVGHRMSRSPSCHPVCECRRQIARSSSPGASVRRQHPVSPSGAVKALMEGRLFRRPKAWREDHGNDHTDGRY